jgi:hypothetical protein
MRRITVTNTKITTCGHTESCQRGEERIIHISSRPHAQRLTARAEHTELERASLVGISRPVRRLLGEEREQPGRRLQFAAGAGIAARGRVEVEPLLGDGAVLGRGRLRGTRNRWKRRHRAPKRQRREVQHTRRQKLHSARREHPRGEPSRRATGGEGGGGWEQGAEHLEVLHAVPPLVELESRLLGPRQRGRRLLRRWWRRLRPARCSGRRGLWRAGEDLDDLLEGGGVRLHEGGGKGVGRVRGHLLQRHRQRGRHRRGRRVRGALSGGGGAGVHEKNVAFVWLASVGSEPRERNRGFYGLFGLWNLELWDLGISTAARDRGERRSFFFVWLRSGIYWQLRDGGLWLLA